MASGNSVLLSPLDQLMPVTYNRVILAFTSDADPMAAIDALKHGFHATCSQLPYLKGRVTKQQHDDNRLAISWSEQDPVPAFQEIQRPLDVPSSYAQLKQEGLPSHRLPQSLCPVAGWVAASFPDGNAPALAVSYTRLDGGILVTVCVHHNVMDGTGTGQLIALWGQNTKADDLPNLLLPEADEPWHRLDRLKAATSPSDNNKSEPESRQIRHSDHRTFESLLASHPEYTTAFSASRPPILPCTSKIFAFPIAKLKTAAAQSKTSVNNILCAVIWSCISTVRSRRWQKESASNPSTTPNPTHSKLGMAVNGRARIGAPLFAEAGTGPPYMGNVNLYCVTRLPLATLTSTSLSPSPSPSDAPPAALATTAHAIAASISRIDTPFIAQVVALASHLHRTLLPGWDFFDGPDLTVTSWANLDTYAVDFGAGLGRPDFVRVPYIEVDGLNIVLPRRRGDAALPEAVVEVVVMLRRDDMAELKEDTVWRDWTTTTDE